MKPSTTLTSSLLPRWLLIAAVMVLALSSPLGVDFVAAASDASAAAQKDLNFNNSFEQAKQVGGFSILMIVFAVFMTGTLACSLFLFGAGVLAFQRTNQWDKLQNNGVAIGVLFTAAVVFFFLMRQESITATQGFTAIAK